jgi:hypothetical protein
MMLITTYFCKISVNSDPISSSATAPSHRHRHWIQRSVQAFRCLVSLSDGCPSSSTRSTTAGPELGCRAGVASPEVFACFLGWSSLSLPNAQAPSDDSLAPSHQLPPSR